MKIYEITTYESKIKHITHTRLIKANNPKEAKEIINSAIQKEWNKKEIPLILMKMKLIEYDDYLEEHITKIGSVEDKT